MKKTLSLIAISSVMLGASAPAQAVNYGGGGAGPSGFTNKTGFVKERTDDANTTDSDDKKGAQEDPNEGDVPASSDDKDDSKD